MPDQVLDLSPFDREFDRLSRALSASEVTDVMRYVAGRVGLKAEELAGEVPPPSRKPLALFYERTRQLPGGGTQTYKSKFKSMKQQRLVMALAAQGKIPRVRSGKLPQSMTSEVVEADENGATVAVGSNLSNAPYVIGDDSQQSHYFRGTWPQLEQTLIKGEDALIATAGNAFLAQVDKRLGGR